MACCSESQCEIPPFRCDCQERCWYDAHHQELDEFGEPPIDPATFYATCAAECPAESIVPNVEPVTEALRPLFYLSTWPSNLERMFSEIPDLEDCANTCNTTSGTALGACNTTFDDCVTTCAGDPDPTTCGEACSNAQRECWGEAFKDEADCVEACFDSGIKAELKKTAGLVTDCQSETGDDAPEDGLELAQCLRHAGGGYIDAVWSDVLTAAEAVRDCAKTLSDCMVDAEGDGVASAACAVTEWECHHDARAAFLRATEAATEEYGTARAECLTAWLRVRGQSSTLDRTQLKLPICNWQFLGAMKTEDLKANAQRMLCAADLADCTHDCDPFEISTPGAPTCIGQCNLEAGICMDTEVNRVRIEKRITACRKWWPRIPEGGEDAPRHPHDHAGDWCQAQCVGLADYCTAALADALSSCVYACCGDADCTDDCHAAIVEPHGSGAPCADAYSECLTGCDYDRDCQRDCLDTYRGCILDVPGDYPICQREVHETEIHEGCIRIGCAAVLPDCPACEEGGGTSDGLLGLSGDWWDWEALAPSENMRGCD